MTGAPNDTDLRLDFARLEGKVDMVITRHDIRIEQLESVAEDHEMRLRAQEAREYVTPKGLWSVVAGVGALVGVIVVIINFLDAQVFTP